MIKDNKTIIETNSRQEDKWDTESKLLFETNSNEDQAQHVRKQVDDTSMQPDTSDESPPLITMYDFAPFQSSQLF